MKDPLVTIVVPTYQRQAYLQEALASALAQNFTDFEVIVSDDGHSPETAAYIDSLRDKRLRYQSNPQRLGIAMNNFRAFSEARGLYLANLHDDDSWEPDFLETLVPPLEADPEIAVAFCDHWMMDQSSRLCPDLTEANTKSYRRHLLSPGRHQPFLRQVVLDQAIPMAMAAVFRKSILQGAAYSRRLRGSYDYWLAYLAVKNGQAVYYSPRRLTRYRVHPTSATGTGGSNYLLGAIYVRGQLSKETALVSYRGRLRHGLGVYYGKMAVHQFSRGANRRGWRFLRRALSLLSQPKNTAALLLNTLLVLGRRKP